MADLLAAARAAGAGETARGELRAVVGTFLDGAAVEPRQEIDARLRRSERPAAGFEVEAASAASPRDRDDLIRRWEEQEHELAPVLHDRGQARHEASQSVGAGGTAGLLAAGHPVDPRGVLDAFTKTAITPLDAEVAEASRVLGRDRSCVEPLGEGQPRGGGPRATAARIARSVRFDPGGPALERIVPAGERLWPAFRMTDSGPVVLLGHVDEPRGDYRILGRLGRAVRAEFLRSRRGARWRWCDPAFETCADVVFRRLALQPFFFERFGVAIGDTGRRQLRLDDALAPRRAWAYLELTMENTTTAAYGLPPRQEVERALRRALARPGTPIERCRAMDCDPRGASELRGTALGLLIEERLLTRFGRGWVDEARAWDFLRDCWEAEPDETAESMAGALGVGTIEPTPVLDGCRP